MRGAKILIRSLAVSMAFVGTASRALSALLSRTAPARQAVRRGERSSLGSDNVPESWMGDQYQPLRVVAKSVSRAPGSNFRVLGSSPNSSCPESSPP